MFLTPFMLPMGKEPVTSRRTQAKVEYSGNLFAVNADMLCQTALDPNLGAGLYLTPQPQNAYSVPVAGLSDAEIIGICSDCRHSEFWCAPFFGMSFSQVPAHTQALVYEKKDGVFGVLLPLVNDTYKCELCGTDTLTAQIFSWYSGLNRCSGYVLVGGEGKDPFALLQDCVSWALQLLGAGIPPRTQRRYPEVFEYLGWCSWDSMQIRVNEAGIAEKCAEFDQKQIPVKWMILDDMWAQVRTFYGAEYHSFAEMVELMHSSPLYDFVADPLRFPHGLQHTVQQIHAGGRKVGIWHPTTGYWFGLDPQGPAFARQKENLYRAPGGQWVPSCEREKAFSYYDRFHSYLRSCGADFVKIDNQSMTRRFYREAAPVGKAARDFHAAMEASVGAHFGGDLINCMGMASEDMWNRPCSAVSRCSDDFLPENKAWFTKHILQCAYNSLIQGQFLWCDWDMWWTDDGQAVKNSVLRAISGGPIYVSDQIGRSKKEVLLPLILSDGKILRCDRPAFPTADCLTCDPTKSGRIFKLHNRCGSGGVIAAFNLNDTPAQGTVSVGDIPELQHTAASRFALYEHFTGRFCVVNKEESLSLRLTPEEFALYTVVPLQNGFAPIGLKDKFIPLKTIACQIGKQVRLLDDGVYLYVENELLHEQPYQNA